MLRLNYVLPMSNEAIVLDTDTEMENYDAWLHHLMSGHTTVNFFYTTETTDIFDDEPLTDEMCYEILWSIDRALFRKCGPQERVQLIRRLLGVGTRR